jgi:hypothetical protein
MKDPLYSAPPKTLRSHQTNVTVVQYDSSQNVNKNEEDINPIRNKSFSVSNSRFIIFQSLF